MDTKKRKKQIGQNKNTKSKNFPKLIDGHWTIVPKAQKTPNMITEKKHCWTKNQNTQISVPATENLSLKNERQLTLKYSYKSVHCSTDILGSGLGRRGWFESNRVTSN